MMFLKCKYFLGELLELRAVSDFPERLRKHRKYSIFDLSAPSNYSFNILVNSR